MRQGFLDFAWHYAYALVAKACYLRFPPKFELPGYSQINDPAVKALASEKFAACFNHLDQTERKYGPQFRPLSYVTKVGYFGVQYSTSTQLHVSDVPEAALADIREFMEQSGVGDFFRSLYRSNYGICNVRVWRYRPKNGDGFDDEVAPHRDELPPYSWKLMYFRDHVNETGGALEIIDDEGNLIHRVVGESPLLIFDSNYLRHRSSAPRDSNRDTIELTIIPQIGNVPQVVSAGYQAGYPVNPFRKWARPAERAVVRCVG